MENHPDQSTKTVRDSSNGLSMAEPNHKPAIDKLKDTAFGFDCCIRRLIQKRFHLPVTLGCVFRGIPPAIPIEGHHRFQWKVSSGRSEATLELKSFPKWMASVNQEAHLFSHKVS
jgi:hypothetical protein